MAIADDFTIDLNGDIRYTGGGSTYYTVLELHRWLQSLADDPQASGNDLLDITSLDSSDRSTDNIITLNAPYNIDKDASEQLYDGSVSQEGGDAMFSGLVVVGAVESGTQLVLIRNNVLITSWWSTGINADAANNILMRTLIQTRQDGNDIDGKKLLVEAREFNDTYGEFSVTLGLGNSTAAIFTGADLNNETAQATVNAWDCVNTEGYQLIDLNDGNGDQPYYSKWDLGARTLINDIYEFTKDIQRRGTSETIHTLNGSLFRGITHEWDYDNETGAMVEDEILAWGTSFPVTTNSGQFTLYETVTFAPSLAVGQLIYETAGAGASGDCVVMLDPLSAEPTSSDTMTGVTSTETADVGVVVGSTATGGTGILLADDATDTMWIQLLKGGPPVDPLFVFGQTSEFSNQVNGSVTARTVSPEFYGASTGTSIIGAHGIGHLDTDLSSADKLFTLIGNLRQPPNNQTFTVSGLISTEDYVIVAANDGADEIDYDQYALQTTLNAGGQTAIVVTGGIEAYTPQTGFIRVELDVGAGSGVYRKVAYTSWSTSGNTTFVTASTDWSSLQATAGNNVFISLIDEIASGTSAEFTGIYSTDDSLVGKVRSGQITSDSPIKPYKTPATWNSSGGGFIATRTSDT